MERTNTGQIKTHVNDTRLKYQSLIDEYSSTAPCPDECKETDSLAYRFVNSELIEEKDFNPTILVDKIKGIVRRRKHANSICKECAISLFDSANNAQTALTYLSEAQRGGFDKKIIAIGLIDKTDGLASTPDMRGHFRFYEYINANIYLKFQPF